MRKPKSKRFQKLQKSNEEEEIKLLDSWIESHKPDSGSNPMSFDPLPREAKVGRLGEQLYSRYAGVIYFSQLPISKKTKDGLRQANFTKMTDIQRACLPHALCGRDILGAAKTGSGKTLAFVIPVLEKLYRERWAPQFGVGSIIISPTRELAGQLFDVLKAVGRHHRFSAGLLIGGRKDVDTEKEHVNDLNILVCTPGRLLQHMDETPNFDCSQLQVLVLDEADRILDKKFERDLNAVISQLPKHRQTLLFSATQTKSVQDLARLSLKDPEYLGVHEESVTATPTMLQQSAMIVPLNQKLDMLWSFIRRHLKSRILVFLSSCKQVRFAFETFKKLRPGIPLKCLHGRMKQETRMAIYMQFCEMHSVLFSTDVAARGLDFNKGVDWVVQVDCPENVAGYIHRVGRTARYLSGGRSLLFLMPSEMKMIEKLRASKVPIEIMKPRKKYLEPISGLLSALMVKYPDMQQLAQRAFITYLKSIHIQKDKEIFDVLKLPLEEYSASLGLPIPPKVRFLGQKLKGKAILTKSSSETETSLQESLLEISRKGIDISDLNVDEPKEGILQEKHSQDEGKQGVSETANNVPITRVSKKKKLKINVHKPTGTKVVFDDEGNALDPSMADAQDKNDSLHLDQDKRKEYYEKLRAQLKQRDKEDKLLHRQRLREKRIKEKEKWRGGDMEREASDEDLSGSEEEPHRKRPRENGKIYFSDDDEYNDDAERTEVTNNAGINANISLQEQEALALKLLNSMHSSPFESGIH